MDLQEDGCGKARAVADRDVINKGLAKMARRRLSINLEIPQPQRSNNPNEHQYGRTTATVPVAAAVQDRSFDSPFSEGSGADASSTFERSS